MAPMKRERCRFSMTVFGKSVYAFGGVSETPLAQVHDDDEGGDEDQLGDEENQQEASSLFGIIDYVHFPWFIRAMLQYKRADMKTS